MGASDAIKFMKFSPSAFGSKCLAAFCVDINWRSCFVREAKQTRCVEACILKFNLGANCNLKLKHRSTSLGRAVHAWCVGLILSPIKNIYVEDLYELGFLNPSKCNGK